MLIREVISERKKINEVAFIPILWGLAAAGYAAYANWDSLQDIHSLWHDYLRGDVTFEELARMAGSDVAYILRDFAISYGVGRALQLSARGLYRLIRTAARRKNQPVSGRDAARAAGELGAAGAAAAVAQQAGDTIY